MYFTDKRHETGGKPKGGFELEEGPGYWRVQSRVKTVFAGLLLCLNIGVDPPDTVKTNPSAKLEAWTDPENPSSPNSKIMEAIGKALQSQYEQLSMRIRYKQVHDPQIDEVKKNCVHLRRNAKEERVLLHYNGHGVPLPTPSGEIWFFNKNYTQYIPISIYDLQFWLGGPSIYVFDCSHAGNVIANFGRFVEKHENENREALAQDPAAQVPFYGENILLTACGANETLPTNPNLPADMFTACLTTPVAISLRCFLLKSDLKHTISLKDLDRVPGNLQNRRSPLGELNWIFTAITDTIAWNCLQKPLFKRMFRQDLMVAALFRNYLLADRLMRQNGCHPETDPPLPLTHNHPLWQSWDLALEMVLVQLPDLIAYEENGIPYEYQHSNFFAEQLSAFELYLSQGALEQKAPDQLPIVLQVLLSQVHRLRALILLSRFLDLGPWAVKLALNIGIFPYVLKLLQSAAIELKPVLIFIWARILAVDNSCQNDLIRDNGYKYFLATIQPDIGIPVANSSEHKAMAAFIIAMFCKDFPQGKVVSMTSDLFKACTDHLKDRDNPLLRQWCCLCISTLWKDYQEAKWTGTRDGAHLKLCRLVIDPVPEVRTAAINALTTFLDYSDHVEQVAMTEQSIAAGLLVMAQDGNSMVRNELLIFFSTFIKRYENRFLVVAYEALLEERQRLQEPIFHNVDVKRSKKGNVTTQSVPHTMTEGISSFSVYATVWKHLMVLTLDPHTSVARKAVMIVDYIYARLLVSPLQVQVRAAMDALAQVGHKVSQSRPPSPAPLQRLANIPSASDHNNKKDDSYFTSGLMKRTTSAIWGTLTFRNSSSTDLPPSKSSAEKLGDNHIRGFAPDEWSRPPDAHDSATPSDHVPKAQIPIPRGYDDTQQIDVTEAVHHGEGAEILPLKSTFLEWSTEYFREPQMKTSELEEPGSDDYNARLWRRARNEKIIDVTQPLKSIAGTNHWDLHSGTFSNSSQPRQLCFHQFEEHIAVSDDKDTISIWNWQRKARLTRFSHGNPKGSRINDLRFINEDDQAILLAGSSDGVIKYYRDYDDAEKISIVSAFRGLTDLIPSTKNVGLVLDWQQTQGKLLVSGDVKVIRIWNAATEICTSVRLLIRCMDNH